MPRQFGARVSNLTRPSWKTDTAAGNHKGIYNVCFFFLRWIEDTPFVCVCISSQQHFFYVSFSALWYFFFSFSFNLKLHRQSCDIMSSIATVLSIFHALFHCRLCIFFGRCWWRRVLFDVCTMSVVWVYNLGVSPRDNGCLGWKEKKIKFYK